MNAKTLNTGLKDRHGREIKLADVLLLADGREAVVHFDVQKGRHVAIPLPTGPASAYLVGVELTPGGDAVIRPGTEADARTDPLPDPDDLRARYAYQEGQQAARSGTSLFHNPYQITRVPWPCIHSKVWRIVYEPDFLAWNAGWEDTSEGQSDPQGHL